HRDARSGDEVDIAGQRCEVARLDHGELGEAAVASPVREAEHPLAHGEPGGPVAERRHDARDLVAGDRRAAVAPLPIRPGRGPVELVAGEPRGVHLDHDIAVARAVETREPRDIRIWTIHQPHPGDARRAVGHDDGLHAVGSPFVSWETTPGCSVSMSSAYAGLRSRKVSTTGQ